MSIHPVPSPLGKRSSQEPKTPSPKRAKAIEEAVAQHLHKTPSPLKDAFKLTPERVIRLGTPSKKHFIGALGSQTGREYRKLRQSLENRLMHTFFTSPSASPKSTREKFPEKVVVGEDGHITSPGGTKYSAHRKPDRDGKHVMFPLRGSKTFRCPGKYALQIVKRHRERNQTQILQDVEAAIRKSSKSSSSSSEEHS